jgi:hypothetical protein
MWQQEHFNAPLLIPPPLLKTSLDIQSALVGQMFLLGVMGMLGPGQNMALSIAGRVINDDRLGNQLS